MKVLGLLTLSFSLLLTATAAHAGRSQHTGYIACENGSFKKMGDGHFAVDVLEDGMEFRPYESGFTIDAADMVNTRDSYAVVGKRVAFSSEGIESSVLVNAIAILSDRDRKMKLALSLDNGAFETYELNCKQK